MLKRLGKGGSSTAWPLRLRERIVVPARGRRIAGTVLSGALLIAALLVPAPIAAKLIVAATAGLVIGAFFRGPQRQGKTRGAIVMSAAGVDRVNGPRRAVLLQWNDRVGLTLLANCARSRMVLAFTAGHATRYVPVRTDNAILKTLRALSSHAATIADADLSTSDGAELSADDALALVEACRARDEGILDRVCLSTTDGAPIDLDRSALKVGGRAFDLHAPLEWQAFMFHESTGPLTTLYQATLVRQTGQEIVLVSPMPGELAIGAGWADAQKKDPSLRALVTRDLKLMQSSPETPPPPERRIALDRLFMLPLRRALDRAPRAKRIMPTPARAKTEGRASRP